MGRSLLAGFAGFCAACALAMLVQLQSVNRVSNDDRHSNARVNRHHEMAEDGGPSNFVPVHFASLRTDGDASTVPTDGTASDPAWTISQVRATTKNSPQLPEKLDLPNPIYFFGPQAIIIEIDIRSQSDAAVAPEEEKTPGIHILHGTDVLPAPVAKAGSPGTWQFKVDRYGEYKIWLMSDGDTLPDDNAKVRSFSVVPEDASKRTDDPRLGLKSTLIVAGDEILNSGTTELKDVYATNGPTATLTIVASFPEKGNLPLTQTLLTRNGKDEIIPTANQASVGANGESAKTFTYHLVETGTYVFTTKGGIDGVTYSKKMEIAITGDSRTPAVPKLVTVSQVREGKNLVYGTNRSLPVIATATEPLRLTVDAVTGRNLRAAIVDPIDNTVKFVSAALTVTAENPIVDVSGLEIAKLSTDAASSLIVVDEWLSGTHRTQPMSVQRESRNITAPEIRQFRISEADSTLFNITGNAISVIGNRPVLTGFTQPGTAVTLTTFQESEDGASFIEHNNRITTAINGSLWQSNNLVLPGNDQGRRVVLAQALSGTASTSSSPLLVTLSRNDAQQTTLTERSVVALDGTAEGRPLTDHVTTFPGVRIQLQVAPLRSGDIFKATLEGTEVGKTVISPEVATTGLVNVDVQPLKEGANAILITMYRGELTQTLQVNVTLLSKGPIVKSVSPTPAGVASPVDVLMVEFDGQVKLNAERAQLKNNYVLLGKTGARVLPQEAKYLEDRNAVQLTFSAVSSDGVTYPKADDYTLHINASPNPALHFGFGDDKTKSGIQDVFGNALAGDGKKNGTDYSKLLIGTPTPPTQPETPSPGGNNNTGFAVRKPLELPALTAEVPNLAALRDVGLPEFKGTPVDYPEFTPPRKEVDGFNPSDKVVSRVARLYYFRDAHRVTQIINRRAKSHNAHNASIARQLADKARLYAEQTVDRRRAAERQAVEAASYARHAENAIAKYRAQMDAASAAARDGKQEIAALQSKLTTLEAAAAKPESPPTEEQKKQIEDTKSRLAQLQQAVKDAEAQATSFKELSSASLAALDALREQEVQQREVMDREQAGEDRAADHQFRLEVQAADTDPDTYAAGNPESQDPVGQVTLSVIGEGLIQMRGPLKGVNLVHTMINEIDSPVGQVRVGIHTVQINGEKGEHMEEVAARIQRYTDHSRFLTSQSAQMLRNAVALVASQKAQQFGLQCEGGTIVCEDGTVIPAGANGLPVDGAVINGLSGMENSPIARYQDAFFGREFMDELRMMDSEFVKPSNKLISLHSMDTTSLASALFLMALASNDTRMEILAAFEQQTMCKLPMDEFEYFEASDTKKWYHFHKFKFMADNARFVSLKGHFDTQIVGDDTLNPAQREFIKLAQILKSRLVTEIELKQRVVERALIEERIGNHREALDRALRTEVDARANLKMQQDQLQAQIAQIISLIAGISTQIDSEKDAQLASIQNSRKSMLVESLAGDIAMLESQRQQLIDVVEKYLPATKQPQTTNQATSVEQYEEKIRQNVESNAKNAIESKKANLFGDPSQTARSYIVGDQTEYVHENLAACATMMSDSSLLKALPAEEQDSLRNRLGAWQENGWEARKDALNWIEDLTTKAQREVSITQIAAETRRIQKNLLYQSLTDVKRGEIDRQLQQLSTSVPTSLRETGNSLSAIYDEIASASKQQQIEADFGPLRDKANSLLKKLRMAAFTSHAGRPHEENSGIWMAYDEWTTLRDLVAGMGNADTEQLKEVDKKLGNLLEAELAFQFSAIAAQAARRPLDHKKFLDMLIDEAEEKHIQLLEGTRAHTAVIDDYVKRICTALEDDFNTQFYEPAFRQIREETYRYGTVSLGQIEHTSILTNNREFAKVQPQATMEFDLPRRRIMVAEAMAAAQAGVNDYGALLNDPAFLALTKLHSGQSTAATHTDDSPNSPVRDILPGLPSQTGESAVIQARTGEPEFNTQLEALIPDPAIYKFETGTGYEIRPVIQPDGQSVVFDFNYMYTTNVREPVDADEKHLGRVKRHFIDTDVQIGNYELREVSRYRVALKAERSARGVPLLEDVPVAGALFRPMNNGESSLQQNVILAQSVIYPTLFDLMGLRWAPAVADLNDEDIKEQEFTYRNRMRNLKNEVYDYSSAQVDEFLRIPQGERRADLYRTQVPIPMQHPNGYIGPGNNQQDSTLQEGYVPQGLPGNSELMLPPSDDAATIYPYQSSNVPDRVPEPLRVTPAAFEMNAAESDRQMDHRVRSADSLPTAQQSNQARNTSGSSSLKTRRPAERLELDAPNLESSDTRIKPALPTSSKVSPPVTQTSTKSTQSTVGRASLTPAGSGVNKKSSMTTPDQKSGWRSRIPGLSRTGTR